MGNSDRILPNELLQYERERRNWSRGYVAERVKVPEVRMIGRWEREGVLPHPVYRQRLCELYGKGAKELGFVRQGEIPFWHVPYRRNPFFTGRETLLTQIHEFLSTKKAAALTQPEAISGLGGIGKTQVALEYAYRYGQQYQAVLWVRAESRDVLISDFAALATLFDLPEKEASDQSQVVDAVKRWLASLSCWLLILDNVDDLEVVSDFLPQVLKGHVLLTTRLQAGGPLAHLIEVEVMENEEGALFLLRRAGIMAQDAPLDSASYEDRVQARVIVQAMGRLPLALDQAGAYIEGTQCGLAEYLARYQTHGSALLRERGKTAPDHPEAVVGTFLLSLEKVEQANTAAADLLRLCAFLAPDAIPEEIITDGASELGPFLGPFAANPLQLDKAINQLLRYSLLRRNPDAGTLTVHRLVQAVLRESMDADTQRLWAERAVRAVNRGFPEVEVATWARCQRCLPHALVCAALIERWGMDFTDATRLLNQAGYYLRVRAHYAEAEPLLTRGLVIRERTLGPDHPAVAQTLNNLAVLYYYQGKYTQAETLYKRALDIRERVQGPAHSEVAQTLNDLAVLYRFQERYTLAEPLYQRALTIREQILGPEHPDVATSLNDLAVLYRFQGKYAQAEPLYQRAIEIVEKTWGLEHPDVASVLSNLATLYDIQNKHSQAEVYYQRALAIDENIFGPKHPEVAIDCNNLAKSYQAQGRYTEAESLYLRALEIGKLTLGHEHPNVATWLHNLAKLYHEQGKYIQAEPLYKQSLAIREKALGPEHSQVATCLNNLAELYTNQGLYTQGEPLFIRSLAIREKVLGKEHPDVVTSLTNLATLYVKQGQYDQAEPLYQRVLAIGEQILRSGRPEIAISLENYAFLLRATNREATAAELETQFQMIRNKHTPKNS